MILTIIPITEEIQRKNDKILDNLSKRFYSQLMRGKYPTPSLLKLFFFRMARSSMGVMLNENNRDYAFYRKNGWFDSEYYYPVKLNPLKKLAGNIIDRRVTYIARTKNKVGLF